MLSIRLRGAIRNSPLRQYEIANAVEIHPSGLSSWMIGATTPRPDDPRLARLAALVGVPVNEALESASLQTAPSDVPSSQMTPSEAV